MPILTVSYDSESLNRQIYELEKAGFVVVPCSSLDSCLNAIAKGAYRLLVIGASVSAVDRKQISAVSKRTRPEARIVSIETMHSPTLKYADYCVKAGDEQALVGIVAELFRTRT